MKQGLSQRSWTYEAGKLTTQNTANANETIAGKNGVYLSVLGRAPPFYVK